MIRTMVRVAVVLGILGYIGYRFRRKRQLRKLAKTKFKVLRGGKSIKRKGAIVNE